MTTIGPCGPGIIIGCWNSIDCWSAPWNSHVAHSSVCVVSAALPKERYCCSSSNSGTASSCSSSSVSYSSAEAPEERETVERASRTSAKLTVLRGLGGDSWAFPASASSTARTLSGGVLLRFPSVSSEGMKHDFERASVGLTTGMRHRMEPMGEPVGAALLRACSWRCRSSPLKPPLCAQWMSR